MIGHDIDTLLESVDRISQLQLDVLSGTREQSGEELDLQVTVFQASLRSISARILELSQDMREEFPADNVRKAYLRRLNGNLDAVEANYTAHRHVYQGMCRELVAMKGQLTADAATHLERMHRSTGVLEYRAK